MDVAENPEIDVFVELIGGCDLARSLVKKAIENGKNVVTANKALIATHGDELFEFARNKNVQIGFEASVAGGTPVIKALREGLVANKVKWFAGILNGTTNFILTKMSVDQSSFEDALKEAQDLGLAEADPSMDVDGTDAAQKASILSALAFNTPYDFSSVSYGGIEEVSAEDISFADQLGYSVKHIAYGFIDNGMVDISVSYFCTKRSTFISSRTTNECLRDLLRRHWFYCLLRTRSWSSTNCICCDCGSSRSL